MADTYYTLENVKSLLGETGDSNNDKLDNYGRMADNEINVALQRVSNPDTGEDEVIPLDPAPEVIHLIADKLALGFFYKFESGSTDIIEDARISLQEYINNKYRRVKFTTAGGNC